MGYCNGRNLGRVLHHVLEWCGVDPERANALQYHLAPKSAAVQIRKALSIARKARKSGKGGTMKELRRRTALHEQSIGMTEPPMLTEDEHEFMTAPSATNE